MQGENLKRRTLTDFDLTEVSILTKTPAYFGTSVEMRDKQCCVREVRATECQITTDFEREPRSEKVQGLPCFFVAQKQIELLKLKGEIYD